MIAFEDLDGSHFEEWGLDTHPHPSRVLGYACRRDDELVALGFVVVDEDNRWWGSFGSRGRFPAKSVHQKTLELFAALDRAGVPEILAVADPEVARSREWLTRLGFEPGENEVWKRGISGSCSSRGWHRAWRSRVNQGGRGPTQGSDAGKGRGRV